jgi:hypothetical protein
MTKRRDVGFSPKILEWRGCEHPLSLNIVSVIASKIVSANLFLQQPPQNPARNRHSTNGRGPEGLRQAAYAYTAREPRLWIRTALI